MPTLAELLQRSRLRVDPRLEGISGEGMRAVERQEAKWNAQRDEIRAVLSGRHPVDVDATLPGGLETHASFLRGARPEGSVSWRDPQGRGEVSATETRDERTLRARYKDAAMEVAMRDWFASQHPDASSPRPTRRGLGVRGQYTVRF